MAHGRRIGRRGRGNSNWRRKAGEGTRQNIQTGGATIFYNKVHK